VATSSLSFNNSSSVAEVRAQVDGLGRPLLAQARQGPGAANYDSVETDYDAVGRVLKSTLPFSSSAGGTNSSAPGTSITAYDALGRQLTLSDSGGGSMSYVYSKNDLLQTIGPAPAGENTKKKQLEYDGLGRLTSVCEITSGTGSASCGQTSAQTGYWTRY